MKVCILLHYYTQQRVIWMHKVAEHILQSFQWTIMEKWKPILGKQQLINTTSRIENLDLQQTLKVMCIDKLHWWKL